MGLEYQKFRRFYRLDASRSTAGNGLGLSMVSAVISMHEGSIQLMDNRPGLKTTMRFPIIESVVPEQSSPHSESLAAA